MTASPPILELVHVRRRFGNVVALEDVSLQIHAGEVHCLLGDNGAGKSTLIKILAGVHPPTRGEYLIDGRPVDLGSPRAARDRGIATVYQDLALVPLMSVARNFFLGREPRRRWLGILPVLDTPRMAEITRARLAEMGLGIRDPDQPVGTMSGGERQGLAIARAVHFGARVLILDEPTAALGVRQAARVIELVQGVRGRGIAVVFITHNVQHALLAGDRFTFLSHGRSLGTCPRGQLGRDEMLEMMAGGGRVEAAFDAAPATG